MTLSGKRSIETGIYCCYFQYQLWDTVKIKLAHVNASLTEVTGYLDSLRIDLNSREEDRSGVRWVQWQYLNQGLADTVRNSLTKNFDLLMEVSSTSEIKSKLRAIKDSVLHDGVIEWKTLYFENTAPLGVSYILAGFEFEILKAGSIVMQGWKK